MHARLRTALRIFRGDESGQSLIIVALSMTLVLAVCALVIDGGLWMVSRHHDQVVADSAALAAANCLAHPGTAPTRFKGATVPACSSGTDTTAATTVANDYAAANGIPSPATNLKLSFDTTNGTVTASASNVSHSLFASLFKMDTTTQSAAGTAMFTTAKTTTSVQPTVTTTVTPTTTTISTPVVSTTTTTTTTPTPCNATAQNQGKCYAIYASNPTCGSNNGWLANSISVALNGAVHSQGSINISNGSFAFNGPATYSSGNCSFTKYGSGTNPIAGGNEPATYWPEDYTQIFPACSAIGIYKCTGPSGTPSYCTKAAANYTFNNTDPTSSLYCAYGAGTPSNPTTWNGYFTIGQGSSLSLSISVICGSFAIGQRSAAFTPFSNNLIVYANSTDSAATTSSGYAIELGTGNGGSFALNGTEFAPNGTVSSNSTSETSVFFEGKNVRTVNGSFAVSGDGPVSGGDQTTTTYNTTTTGYNTNTITTQSTTTATIYNTTTTSTPGSNSLYK